MPNILIVEDELPLLKNLLTFLRLEKYDCVGVSDSNQIMDEYSKMGHVDLVILDYLLKNVQGNQILRQMRKINPEQKIILTSGVDTHFDLSPDEMKNVAIFMKPLNIKELLSLVNKIIYSF